MSVKQDHYITLGLSPDAAQEDVGRRYRYLARKYHPDLAADKVEATEKLILINQAYSVLRDVDRRREYDEVRRRTLAARGQQGEYKLVFSHGSDRYSKDSSPARRFVGAKRTTTHSESIPTPSVAPTKHTNDANAAFSNGVNNSPTGARTIDHLARAENELKLGNYERAGRICRRYVAANPESRRAHELLGDIYAREGKVDEAMTAYLAALHQAPNDSRIRAKLQLLKASAVFNLEEVISSKSHRVDIVAPPLKPEKEKQPTVLNRIISTLSSFFR